MRCGVAEQNVPTIFKLSKLTALEVRISNTCNFGDVTSNGHKFQEFIGFYINRNRRRTKYASISLQPIDFENMQQRYIRFSISAQFSCSFQLYRRCRFYYYIVRLRLYCTEYIHASARAHEQMTRNYLFIVMIHDLN